MSTRTAIDVFAHYYAQLEAGETGIVAEADIEPLADPTRLADLSADAEAGRAALDQTVVIKLNGGLGTGMGMDKAKSLLPGPRRPDLPRHRRSPGAAPQASRRVSGCR